jgi:hypothetical protein
MNMTVDPGTRPQSDRESCVDYCPDAACACRIRVIAGCSLPLADDAAGIGPQPTAPEGRPRRP